MRGRAPSGLEVDLVGFWTEGLDHGPEGSAGNSLGWGAAVCPATSWVRFSAKAFAVRRCESPQGLNMRLRHDGASRLIVGVRRGYLTKTWFTLTRRRDLHDHADVRRSSLGKSGKVVEGDSRRKASAAGLSSAGRDQDEDRDRDERKKTKAQV